MRTLILSQPLSTSQSATYIKHADKEYQNAFHLQYTYTYFARHRSPMSRSS